MRFVLDNGLTWLHEPVHHSPVVALQVWVKVGSADETPEELGLAHLHEHMLFKGTERRGPGEIARDVEAHGGEVNAWTSFDQTVYHVVLASRFFAQGLDVLGDAIRHSAFDPGELGREIEVVVEEIKRSLDMPTRKLSKAVFALTFTEHPYGRPVIGTEQSVRSMTSAKMRAFYEKHYRPDNMVVVVSGDVTREVAEAEVQKVFGGSWGKPKAPPAARAVEPPQPGQRIEVLKDDVKEAHLSLSFPIPGVSHPDTVALDALALILGQGESCRLETHVRREGKVTDARAYAYTPRDPGMFSLDATLEPEQLAHAVPALLDEGLRLKTELVLPSELAAAQTLLESDAIFQRETVQGLARRMGYYETTAGGAEGEAAYQAQVQALTPQMLQDVAKKYLDLNKLTAAALVPDSSDFDAHALQRAIASFGGPLVREPEPSGPTLPFRPSVVRTGTGNAVERHVLANGTVLLVKPEPGVPLVAMRAVLPGGLLYEDDATNGMHQLLARTMTQGAGDRSAEELARLADALAGSVSGNAGRNSYGLRGEFLSKHLGVGFEVFSDCLLRPTFEESEVARERLVQLQQIKSRDDHPSGIAFRLFHRAMYGAHPYHRDLQGEKAPVEAVTGAALAASHQARLGQGGLVVSVVGDIEPADVLRAAEAQLAGLPGNAPRPPTYAPFAPPTEAKVAQQDTLKAQAHLVYGFPGLTVKDPDRHALEVLTSILSGQGGRLFIELRDKRSMAYSVSAFALEGVDPGYFAVYMGTSQEKSGEAFKGIQAELQKVLDARVSEAELDRARNYLIGAHAIGLQKNASRAGVLALDEAYGLGIENHKHHAERILAVDAAAVQGVAQRLLRFDRAVLGVLGPKP